MKAFDEIPVSMLRQYLFCPRIPYFLEVLGIVPARPEWVRQGGSYHDRQEIISKNRAFKKFGLSDAIKHFRKPVNSKELGFQGIADLILEMPDEIIPVEFKTSSSRSSRGAIIQLTAYGLIFALSSGKKFEKGFIISGRPAKTHYFEISPKIQDDTRRIMTQLQAMMMTGRMPFSSADINKCSQCEFLNFCNDRI